MKRRLLALSLLVALPTVLLALGWLRASHNAHQVLVQAQRNRLLRAIQTTHDRIEEKLEELRTKEDERPFYLYNHYYSPPDVIAISDPVARSPLADPPPDTRVLGYFQMEPGAVLRTPYSTGESEDLPSERERAVRNAVLSSAFADDWALWLGAAGSEILGDIQVERASLTTGYRAWGNAVATDIQLAQQGSRAAQIRVSERGRSAPRTLRNNIRPQVDERPAQADERPAPQRNSAAGMFTDPAPARRVEPAIRTHSTLQDVEYTPMRWTSPGPHLALQRIVTHAGVPVIQGVLLDRRYLYEEWLPAQVHIHTPPEYAAEIIPAGDRAECSARAVVSSSLSMDVCISVATLARLTAGFEQDHTVQMVLVFGLLMLVLLALMAVVRASERSSRLARRQADFVSAVSHELRTPLTTLRMHAEMLDENLVSPDRLAQVHRQMVAESVRLARLVDNVLEVSRLDGGERRLRLQHSDLGAHVERIVAGQRASLQMKGLDVCYVGPEQPTVVMFDPQAMEQIIVNLLDNAAKYAASTEEAFEVHLIPKEGNITISVRDRGPGIPKAARNKVFERFYRVERPETAHTPGTGIGLALVRALALAQRGHASVHGRPGGGADVRVTLPTQ